MQFISSKKDIYHLFCVEESQFNFEMALLLVNLVFLVCYFIVLFLLFIFIFIFYFYFLFFYFSYLFLPLFFFFFFFFCRT